MMNKLDELEKTADFFAEDSIYGFDTSEVNEFAKETKKLIAVARAVCHYDRCEIPTRIIEAIDALDPALKPWKKLKWFREGEPIPFGSRFVKSEKRKVGKETTQEEDFPYGGTSGRASVTRDTWEEQFLYEVPDPK